MIFPVLNFVLGNCDSSKHILLFHNVSVSLLTEVGSNLSQEGDGHIVGKNMCVEEAQFSNAKFSTGKIILPHWGLHH